MKLSPSTRTDLFLKLIAQHLSSNPKCRQKEYEIIISDAIITMHPYIEVFPDIHHRQSTDKENVVYHSVYRHLFNDNSVGAVRSARKISIPQRKFINGTYIYKLSANKKSRKWAKKQKGSRYNI